MWDFREHDGVLLYRHSGKPEGLIRNPVKNNNRAKRGLYYLDSGFRQNDKIRFRGNDGVLLYRHSGKPEGIIRNPIRNNGRTKRGLLILDTGIRQYDENG